MRHESESQLEISRRVIRTLWENLTPEKQQTVWDELSDAGAAELATALPPIPQEEQDLLMGKARNLIRLGGNLEFKEGSEWFRNLSPEQQKLLDARN